MIVLYFISQNIFFNKYITLPCGSCSIIHQKNIPGKRVKRKYKQYIFKIFFTLQIMFCSIFPLHWEDWPTWRKWFNWYRLSHKKILYINRKSGHENIIKQQVQLLWMPLSSVFPCCKATIFLIKLWATPGFISKNSLTNIILWIYQILSLYYVKSIYLILYC